MKLWLKMDGSHMPFSNKREVECFAKA